MTHKPEALLSIIHGNNSISTVGFDTCKTKFCGKSLEFMVQCIPWAFIKKNTWVPILSYNPNLIKVSQPEILDFNQLDISSSTLDPLSGRSQLYFNNLPWYTGRGFTVLSHMSMQKIFLLSLIDDSSYMALGIFKLNSYLKIHYFKRCFLNNFLNIQKIMRKDPFCTGCIIHICITQVNIYWVNTF